MKHLTECQKLILPLAGKRFVDRHYSASTDPNLIDAYIINTLEYEHSYIRLD